MAEKPETGRDAADLRTASAGATVPALKDWFVREVLPLEATLMQFLRRSGRSKSDIDDLIQDVYVRVCEAAAKQIPDPAKPFVFTVARNLLIDRLRHEQVVAIETVEDLDALNIAIDTPGPDQTMIAREELRRIQSALDKLPRRAREAVILRKIEGLSWKEIGQRMGIAERTVNRHLTDAMHALADQLYGEQSDPRRKP